jgi:hypothetical protein
VLDPLLCRVDPHTGRSDSSASSELSISVHAMKWLYIFVSLAL